MTRDISIVIPAFNEEKRILSSLKKIIKFCEKKEFNYEIIVVDDGSRDKTVEVVSRLDNKNTKIIKNEKRMGKGAAVRKGVLAAQKSAILFSDADLSTPIHELDNFLPHLGQYDIVLGSRALEDSQVKVHQARYKEILGKFGNRLIKFLLVKGINDTQCGFKLFKKECQSLFKKQTISGWAFDFEILFLAKKEGYRIKEMPVIWINDYRSKVSSFDYFRTLGELLKIKLNDIRGRYQ